MAAPPPSSSTISSAVYRLQMILLEQGAPSERHLLAAASLLSRSDYSDVVTERSIASLCGFPLCPRALPAQSPSLSKSGRYRISLSEHRVYDLEERSKFCSEECLIGSRAYEASLSEERSSHLDLTNARLQHIFNLFCNDDQDLKSPLQQHTITDTSDLNLKLNLNSNLKGEVPVEDWIGPPDAIEGYVPKSTSKSKSTSRQDSGLELTADEMDFESEIIFHDEDHDFSSFKTRDISDQISKKLESIVLDEGSNTKRNRGTKSSSKLPRAKADKKLTSSEQRNSKSASGEGHSHQSGFKLKSSLKKEYSTSGPRTQNQSVRWADEERSYAKESSEKSGVLSEEDAAVRSLRVASAEACAAALSHAADIVSSGNSKAEDAVSETGIVILPQPSCGTEKEPHENREGDTQEIEREVMKWPQKPVLLETDMFEVDDSWHDTAPEGFNLDLSPFGTMWLAIFGWVTRSTLCYIYGHDESLSEEFSEVEGREYPQQVVLKEGQSAEIRMALDGYVCRALPSLVLDLRLPVPISTLEKYLGRLMDTMTFAEALPALRTRQWHVVVLLFLDALSVHHLPSISSVMANRSMLLHKVLNGTQIEPTHYDSMIDVFLPLGRSTSLSFQKSSR